MKRSDIVAAARRLVGTPYVHAGRHPLHGVDCVGVCSCTADVLNYPYTDIVNYPSWPDGQLVTHLQNFADRVAVGTQRPGDVGVMWINRHSKVPQHVGIFTDLPDDQLGLVHAFIKVGRVVESNFDKPWQHRLMAVLRFRGLED